MMSWLTNGFWVSGVCLIFMSLNGSMAADAPTGEGGGSAESTPVDPGIDLEVTPSHPFQRVALIRKELELIRLEMGKLRAAHPSLRVENAAPREVYFQAETLLRKADRLVFEHTREREKAPPLPLGEIRPAHVYQVLGAALGRVRRLKEILAITEEVEVPRLIPDIQPSQVLNMIVNANQEINELLTRRFSPSDVFEQVTVSIAYTARLVDSFAGVKSPPEPPPFERRKRPADVYRSLLGCFQKIQRIGEIDQVPMLQLQVAEADIQKAEPSDVYDIASLVLSELIHLHGRRAGARPPRKVYRAGRKLPSHVYQRVGILDKQLDELMRCVQKDGS